MQNAEQRKVNIFHLAILRAVVEGQQIGQYLGSWTQLKHWVEEAVKVGLIYQTDGPERSTKTKDYLWTDDGIAIYHTFNLAMKGPSRSYLWPDARQLERDVNRLLNYEGADDGR